MLFKSRINFAERKRHRGYLCSSSNPQCRFVDLKISPQIDLNFHSLRFQARDMNSVFLSLLLCSLYVCVISKPAAIQIIGLIS
jgi:hypothetical protein